MQVHESIVFWKLTWKHKSFPGSIMCTMTTINTCNTNNSILCVSPEDKIRRFLASVRAVGLSITPKLHCLEEHTVPFLEKWNIGLAYMGEQGKENNTCNHLPVKLLEILKQWVYPFLQREKNVHAFHTPMANTLHPMLIFYILIRWWEATFMLQEGWGCGDT